MMMNIHKSTAIPLVAIPAVLLMLLLGDANAATIVGVHGEILEGHPIIGISLSEEIEATKTSLIQALTDPKNYEVLAGGEQTDANGSTAVLPQVVKVERVYFLPRDNGTTNYGNLTLQLAGITYLRGTLVIHAISADGDSVPEQRLPWRIVDPSTYLPKPIKEFNLGLPDGRAVAIFNVVQTSRFRVSGTRVSRTWLKAEGNVPLTTPRDVDNTPGAKTDASEDVADYVSLSFTRRTYNGNSISSLGLVARATGRLNSPEVVVQYQPFARFLNRGHAFVGAQSELGFRDGAEEWKNLTTPAPDRGNVVARLAGVVEWAPKIGKVNLDLGHGLRFYVRGRAWADYAKNDSGNNSVRLRPFLDSEVFYNITNNARVFLRYENGYLPPDLSGRTNKGFAGVGTSF